MCLSEAQSPTSFGSRWSSTKERQILQKKPTREMGFCQCLQLQKETAQLQGQNGLITGAEINWESLATWTLPLVQFLGCKWLEDGAARQGQRVFSFPWTSTFGHNEDQDTALAGPLVWELSCCSQHCTWDSFTTGGFIWGFFSSLKYSMWDRDNLHAGYSEAETIDSLLKQRSFMFLCY